MGVVDRIASANAEPKWAGSACYKFAHALTSVRSDDAEFLSRFRSWFRDFEEPPFGTSGTAGPSQCIQLDVAALAYPDVVMAAVSSLDEDWVEGTLSALFPELRIAAEPSESSARWRFFSCGPDRHPMIAAGEGKLLIDRSLPWARIISHYFLEHVMRLHGADFLFLHAAAVTIHGRGVLLAGEKGAGKSTLSLALASRGHGFLGDEVAAVRVNDKALLPFRRLASLRPGPQAEPIRRFLIEHPSEHHVLADGSIRQRMAVSNVFPQVDSRSAELSCAFFLHDRATAPSVEPFSFSLRHLSLLAAFPEKLPSAAGVQRVLSTLGIFGSIKCFSLIPGGTPDDTADLIQATVEKPWETSSSSEQRPLAHSAG